MEASLPELILPVNLEKSSERLTSLWGLVVLEELARADSAVPTFRLGSGQEAFRRNSGRLSGTQLRDAALGAGEPGEGHL